MFGMRDKINMKYAYFFHNSSRVGRNAENTKPYLKFGVANVLLVRPEVFMFLSSLVASREYFHFSVTKQLPMKILFSASSVG